MRLRNRVKTTPRGDPRGGYVLVALLASSAIMLAALALTVPRMAVQAQRVKEETLVYRGKQYQRAIELYFRAHKKYPEEIDDLEETEGVRYLRKRYKDPLTGEDEWRLIRMGANGRFKDSLIYDLAEEVEEDGLGSAFGQSSGLSGFGGGTAQRRDAGGLASDGRPGPGGSAQERVAEQRRAALPPPPVGQFQGGARARAVRRSAAPDQTQQARYNQGFEFPEGTQPPGGEQPPQAGPGGRPVPGQPDYSAVLPSQMPMFENQPLPDPNAPFGRQGRRQPAPGPNRGAPGFGGMQPSMPIGFQTPPGAPGYGAGGAPGQFPSAPGQFPGAAGGRLRVTPGGAPAGFGAQGISSGATSIIQKLLTTPRPGGLAGLQGYAQAQQAAAGAPTAAFQEGIAGVASLVEDFGVKTYQGREMYNEWEFVYDYRKDQEGGSGAAGGAAAGLAGGTAAEAQQETTAAPYPASGAGGLGAYGAAAGLSPGTPAPGLPGYGAAPSQGTGTPGYGGPPGAAGPYLPDPDGPFPQPGEGPYGPPGTPPAGIPGAPFPYGLPPGAIDPNRPIPPVGPRPPYLPPSPNDVRRGK